MKNSRNQEFPIDSIFINRRSSRAIADQPVTHEELMSLFEAARWAPSSLNAQPWRFVYAQKNMAQWKDFFNLMDASNKVWAQQADTMVIVVAHLTSGYNGSRARTALYDVGAACQNLALQGSISGLVVRAIGGFDYEKANALLKLSQDYEVVVMFVIGKPGAIKDLPEKLQIKEEYSTRRALKDFVFKGEFIP